MNLFDILDDYGFIFFAAGFVLLYVLLVVRRKKNEPIYVELLEAPEQVQNNMQRMAVYLVKRLAKAKSLQEIKFIEATEVDHFKHVFRDVEGVDAEIEDLNNYLQSQINLLSVVGLQKSVSR